MKQSFLAIVAIIGLIAATEAPAADSGVRLDRVEQQITRISAELEHMRATMQIMDERLDTVDDMEITLVRMEHKLQDMRRQLRKSRIDSAHVRPMLVPATW